MLASNDRASVSERALIKRVNRVLLNSDLRLLKNRATRSKRAGAKLTKREVELGTFFIVATVPYGKQRVVLKHINLESYARALDVIQPYEFLDTVAQ